MHDLKIPMSKRASTRVLEETAKRLGLVVVTEKGQPYMVSKDYPSAHSTTTEKEKAHV